MAQSEAFWDKRSKAYDDNVGKPNPAREQRVARTKALLGESHVVLDFGCATGEMSLAIAPDVYQIQGIDLSRENGAQTVEAPRNGGDEAPFALHVRGDRPERPWIAWSARQPGSSR